VPRESMLRRPSHLFIDPSHTATADVAASANGFGRSEMHRPCGARRYLEAPDPRRSWSQLGLEVACHLPIRTSVAPTISIS
jgi:hypothetical protein